MKSEMELSGGRDISREMKEDAGNGSVSFLVGLRKKMLHIAWSFYQALLCCCVLSSRTILITYVPCHIFSALNWTAYKISLHSTHTYFYFSDLSFFFCFCVFLFLMEKKALESEWIYAFSAYLNANVCCTTPLVF